MNSVPNELKITINTSIPGFQSIKYKPYMTLPNDRSDDSVQFNPLVKLKPSVIKSMPSNIQVSEFFNKGLFQSLINSHGLVKAKSLVEATNNGYIDNNIKVTLDTLFPSNSVLYINNQPYAIADVQWRKGDWKIDKKIQQLPELESSNIVDPYLYRTVVKDEIISGENELQQIPKEIVYGATYTGPQNVASGIKNVSNSNALASTTFGNPATDTINIDNNANGVSPIKPQKPVKPTTTTTSRTLVSPSVSLEYEAREKEIQNQFLKIKQQQDALLQQQQLVAQQLLKQENKISKDKRNLFLQQQEQIAREREKLNLQQQVLSQELYMLKHKFESQRLQIGNRENINPKTRYPALPPSKPFGNPFDNPSLIMPPPRNPFDSPYLIMPPPNVEELEDEEINSGSSYNIVLETSEASTKTLQNFFNNNNYYFMLNIMFKNMDLQNKNKINEIFKQTTNVSAKSTTNLSQTAYKNTVENMHVIKNAGGGNCFFIALADAINYYNKTAINVDKIIYKNYGKGNVPFNQLLLRQLVGYYILHVNTMSFNDLIDILQDNANVYNNMFRLEYEEYKKNVLHKEDITPDIFFDIINNIYYGNDNFLIMKPTKMTSETLKTPFRMVKQNELEKYINSADYWANPIAVNALCEILGLNVIIIENKNDMMRIPYIYDGNKETSKYLFLFHEYNHYELITFDYIFNSKPVTKVIFKNNYLTPPFYIIFLIFASNYIKIIDANDKKNFKLLQNFMKALFEIYNKIEIKAKTKGRILTKNKENVQFINLFNRFFLQPTIQGGSLSPYEYRMNNPYQNQPQYMPRFIKKNSSTNFDTPQSNISYYITIDMYIQKGTSLSRNEVSNLKCRKRWNAIRKSYADLRGLTYVIKPDYNNLPSTKTENSKNSKSKTQKGGLRLQIKKSNNKTRRHNNYLLS
uniref:OTU domain-containing protein n=1 Tax=viral metagenome TaxID=1070528 RepID=A0A6C0JFD0_9ZZZZ